MWVVEKRGGCGADAEKRGAVELAAELAVEKRWWRRVGCNEEAVIGDCDNSGCEQ